MTVHCVCKNGLNYNVYVHKISICFFYADYKKIQYDVIIATKRKMRSMKADE